MKHLYNGFNNVHASSVNLFFQFSTYYCLNKKLNSFVIVPFSIIKYLLHIK
jgi:hypothetical protein